MSIDTSERIEDWRLAAIIREDAVDPLRGCDSCSPHEVAMLAWEVERLRKATAELEAEVERLKEYESMYKGLCR